MSKPAETTAPKSTYGTVWVSVNKVSANTEAPRLGADGLLYSRAKAGVTEPHDSTDDNNVLTIRSDELAHKSPAMPLSAGRRRIEATILEFDEISVVCEIKLADRDSVVTLPKDLVPKSLGYGAPVWLSIDESIGPRRFVVTARDADPAHLAEGSDEVDELVESLRDD